MSSVENWPIQHENMRSSQPFYICRGHLAIQNICKQPTRPFQDTTGPILHPTRSIQGIGLSRLHSITQIEVFSFGCHIKRLMPAPVLLLRRLPIANQLPRPTGQTGLRLHRRLERFRRRHDPADEDLHHGDQLLDRKPGLSGQSWRKVLEVKMDPNEHLSPLELGQWLWVLFPRGAGLFSSLSIPQWSILNLIPRGG